MAETVSIDIGGLQQLQETLRILGTNLANMVMTATEEIAADTRGAITDIYPGQLSDQFDVTVGDEGGLASVTAMSADPYVLWYEYGTRPHAITPTAGKQALKFVAPWSGAEEFFTLVHQSERAHNGTIALKLAMHTSALERWTEAIYALLDDLELG